MAAANNEVLHEKPKATRFKKISAIDLAQELDQLRLFSDESVARAWQDGGFPAELDDGDFARLVELLLGVPAASPMTRRLFRLAGGGAAVRRPEFVGLLKTLSVGEETTKLDAMFELFDLDGDGHITQQEFSDAVHTVWSSAKALGLVRFAVEESRIYGADVFARRVFAALDKDRDGRLTRDEYHAAVRQYMRYGQPMQIIDTQCGGHVGAFQITAPGRLRKQVGRAEMMFFRDRLPTTPGLAPFCPQLFGVEESHDGKCYVEMEDLCRGYGKPCVLDLKMGTSTIGPDASPEKRAFVLDKDSKTTTAALGMRFTGMRVWNGATAQFDRYNKSWGRAVAVDRFVDALALYLRASAAPQQLAARFLQKILPLQAYIAQQSHLQFVSSSLLFVYDAASVDQEERLKMIDFAHVFPTPTPDELDQGYLVGLSHLVAFFRQLSEHFPDAHPDLF